MVDIYNIDVKDSANSNISMSEFAGKTLLIVNVASKCGLTPQYEGLQKIYDDYKDRNFVVLGFPCNQFGKQEPHPNPVIKEFVAGYGVTFRMMDKIKVNGPEAHPVFLFCKTQLPGFFGSFVKWNFTKFVFDRSGKPVKRFGPKDNPSKMEELLVELL